MFDRVEVNRVPKNVRRRKCIYGGRAYPRRSSNVAQISEEGLWRLHMH